MVLCSNDVDTQHSNPVTYGTNSDEAALFRQLLGLALIQSNTRWQCCSFGCCSAGIYAIELMKAKRYCTPLVDSVGSDAMML